MDMAKIAMVAKNDFVKFNGLSTDEKKAYQTKAKTAYTKCLEHFNLYAEKEQIPDEQRTEFVELIRENIICESMVLSPNDPREAHAACMLALSNMLSMLFENAKEGKADTIQEYISSRTNEEAKAEIEDIMPVLRFFVKYHSVGTDNEDEQLQ